MITWKRWGWVVLFAIAMAWMEAATVVYLRGLVGRLEPYQPNPLPDLPQLGSTELIREAATLLMLWATGWLAGGTWRSRFGFFSVAFGVWDILYYVFLKCICGWPNSIWDWDVLFLLPLPWWGPVWSPVLIALLLIVGGTLMARFDTAERPLWPRRACVLVNGVGVILALYVFMADALRALPQGEAAVRQVLPARFNGPLFLLACALMAVPIVDLGLQIPGLQNGEPDRQ